jgi:hypothetical protein
VRFAVIAKMREAWRAVVDHLAGCSARGAHEVMRHTPVMDCIR